MKIIGKSRKFKGESRKITENHQKTTGEIGEIPRAAGKFALDFDSPAADFSKMSFGNGK